MQDIEFTFLEVCLPFTEHAFPKHIITGMTNVLISTPGTARHATTPTPMTPQANLKPEPKRNQNCRKSNA